MPIFGLNETIDQLAMANSVHWYDHLLRSGNNHALKKSLVLEVKGQEKKLSPKKT